MALWLGRLLSSVCMASCVSLLCVYARAYAIVQSFTLAKGNWPIYSFIRQKRSIQNTYLIFTTPWALENEKLRRRRYTGAQMQFKSSYHQIPALSRLPIDGLSPTLSIMTAGINIDWWAVIMEWLIICSQCGFGPINEAFFSQNEIEALTHHFPIFFIFVPFFCFNQTRFTVQVL